jgi:hypothetical protein
MISTARRIVSVSVTVVAVVEHILAMGAAECLRVLPLDELRMAYGAFY